MPTIVSCPGCEKKIKVPDDAEGKKIRCGGCQEILLITEDGLEPVTKIKDEAPRPERKTAPAEDEDETPKRNRVVDEDEEDEPKPKRKRRSEEEEEDEDEDERPVSRKKKRKKTGGGIPMWVWLAGGGGLLGVSLIVLLIVLLGGGGKFNKISVGMTEKEVTTLLGSPNVQLADVAIWFDPPVTQADFQNRTKPKKVKAGLVVIYANGKVKDKQVLTGAEASSEKPPRILENHPLFGK